MNKPLQRIRRPIDRLRVGAYVELMPDKSKPPVSTVLITAVVIGGGLAISRADWEAIAKSDETLLGTVLFVGAMFALLAGVTYLLVKGWDALWAFLKRTYRSTNRHRLD